MTDGAEGLHPHHSKVGVEEYETAVRRKPGSRVRESLRSWVRRRVMVGVGDEGEEKGEEKGDGGE